MDGQARREAARWLASVGFETVEVEDPRRALDVFEKQRPDITLTDMAPCDERGLGLCQALRQRPEGREIPILVLCSSHREAEAALTVGATDLLERPLDWHVASVRARRLVRLAETKSRLDSLRAEMDRLRQTIDDEQRERAWRDHFDSLTGLPDAERLERALESALVSAAEGRLVALALFDVDHLVAVNSRLGRARANSVLQQVAQRLVAGLRSEAGLQAQAGPSMSMAARVGGGQFAALITGLPGWQEARAAIRHLRDCLSGRYFAGSEETLISINVGVALAPTDGLTAETMLQKAELAAREAAESGGAIRFYGQSCHRVTERSQTITRLLPEAIARGDFELRYQPLVDIASSRICAVEALLRWECPQLGPVPPSEFVQLAEEAGLMVALGTWVLKTACRQARAWQDQGLPPSRISVNVSLCQLVRGDLSQEVREILDETGLAAELLELELSERGVLRSDPDILRQLHAIRELGVRLAIDDFGTGNSAIAYLKQFPIDVLKIDQSFVQGVVKSSEDAAITSATIAMARQLGLGVVAEGVEEQGQIDFLRRHGCSEFQGFLFSPAVPADELAEMRRRELGPQHGV